MRVGCFRGCAVVCFALAPCVVLRCSAVRAIGGVTDSTHSLLFVAYDTCRPTYGTCSNVATDWAMKLNRSTDRIPTMVPPHLCISSWKTSRRALCVSLLPGKSCFFFLKLIIITRSSHAELCKHNEGELVVQLFLHNVPFD